MAAAPMTTVAAAKVNLFLHVDARRSDSYHDITSLVAFADFGDELILEPAPELSLSVKGAFAAQTGAKSDNNVLQAGLLFKGEFKAQTLGAFHLFKTIPVAAGLGGGSTDAAAALRLLAKANGLDAQDQMFYDLARRCGADVPICLYGKPAIMRGIGEQIEPVALPKLHAVVVNCGTGLSTKEVFEKYRFEQRDPAPHLPQFSAGADVIEFLRACRNDLETPAKELCPDIYDCKNALLNTGAALARMSGSGATVFGLYDNNASSIKAAVLIKKRQPEWFVRQTVLS